MILPEVLFAGLFWNLIHTGRSAAGDTSDFFNLEILTGGPKHCFLQNTDGDETSRFVMLGPPAAGAFFVHVVVGVGLLTQVSLEIYVLVAFIRVPIGKALRARPAKPKMAGCSWRVYRKVARPMRINMARAPRGP
jgi:hypothetical protein